MARVPPARADPIGALASRFDEVILLAADGLSPAPPASAPAPVPAGPVATLAPTGDPQTSQYPSTMVPPQPGWVQATPSAAGELGDVLMRSLPWVRCSAAPCVRPRR